MCGFSLGDACPSCGASTTPDAKFCSQCGKALSSRPDADRTVTAAERRQLTVLFFDLVGSTDLASRVDPEDLREAMAIFQRCGAEAINRRGGFVDHFRGDGAPAYFGYPVARADDAERAIRAALDMVAAVSRLTLLDGYHPQVRIGIATGLCVVSNNRRSGALPELEVTGQTVNLAARLQGEADPNGIVVAASTRRLAGDLFAYQALGELPLKGFPQPVTVWRVLGASGATTRFDSQQDVTLRPLVGRDRELDLLKRRWQQARGDRGQVVLIRGEPGIGKSRLAVRLQEQLGEERHARLRYFCSPDGLSTPFHPFIRQIEHALGFSPGDSPATRIDKLIEEFTSFSPLTDVAAIADLLSLPHDDRLPSLELDPRKRRSMTMDALLRVVEQFGKRQPVLMILEDAQWIDPTSRELLDLAVARMAAWPVLLLVTSRSDFAPEWTDLPYVSKMVLAPLDRAQSATVIKDVAADHALPESTINDIVERADGVPLFLEELTMAMLEMGADHGTDRGILVRMPALRSEVPVALQASLMERLDRLGPAREIAHVGAAIGREFSAELVATVAQRSGEDLEAALKALVDSGLLVRRQSRRRYYQFKHALIRDAAYGTMLRGTRRTLHARIAEALERSSTEGAEPPQLLAYHFTEAGLPDKALDHWIRAGQHALRKSAMAEAISCFGEGLALYSSIADSKWRSERELELQLALGSALIATKGYVAPQTIDCFSRARELCKQLNQSRLPVSVIHGQWVQDFMRNELLSARRQAGELLELGERTGDGYWKWTGHRLLGTTSYPLGEFRAGYANLERSLSIYEEAIAPNRDVSPRNDAHAARLRVLDESHVLELAYASWNLLYLGLLDQARRRRDQALEHAHNHPQAYTLAHAVNGRAYIELMLNTPHAALEELRKLETLTGGHEIMYYHAMGGVFRGWCLAAIGAPHEGISQIRQSIRGYRTMGALVYLPSLLKFLADAYGMAGEPAKGLETLIEAKAIVASTQSRQDEAEILRVRGELMAALGEHGAAEQDLKSAMATAQQQGARLLELRAAASYAHFWRDRGDLAKGRAPLLSVLEWFTEGQDTAAIRGAKAILGATA